MVDCLCSLEICIAGLGYSLDGRSRMRICATVGEEKAVVLTESEPAMLTSSSKLVHARRTMCQVSSKPDSRSVISRQSRLVSLRVDCVDRGGYV